MPRVPKRRTIEVDAEEVRRLVAEVEVLRHALWDLLGRVRMGQGEPHPVYPCPPTAQLIEQAARQAVGHVPQEDDIPF